jgi:hypothetical protein
MAMVTGWFVAALLVPPIALGFWHRVRTSAVIVTIVLTSAAALAVSLVICRDPSDIGALAAFFLAFGPAVAVPTATITAVAFARTGAISLLGAAFLALIGWASGIAVMFTVGSVAQADVWLYLLGIAAPSIYCACGAMLATGMKWPS